MVIGSSSGGMKRFRSSLDLADESLRVMEKSDHGAVIRLKMLKTSDFVLKLAELPLKLTPIRGLNGGPDRIADVLGASAGLEEAAKDGWREVCAARDGVDALFFGVILAPG